MQTKRKNFQYQALPSKTQKALDYLRRVDPLAITKDELFVRLTETIRRGDEIKKEIAEAQSPASLKKQLAVVHKVSFAGQMPEHVERELRKTDELMRESFQALANQRILNALWKLQDNASVGEADVEPVAKAVSAFHEAIKIFDHHNSIKFVDQQCIYALAAADILARAAESFGKRGKRDLAGKARQAGQKFLMLNFPLPFNG